MLSCDWIVYSVLKGLTGSPGFMGLSGVPVSTYFSGFIYSGPKLYKKGLISSNRP